MVHEDYLPCSAYENQPAHPKESNFSAFFDEESQRHFFALLDADGKVLLKSEGYPQPAARENGIQSVVKNRSIHDFYSVKQEDGKYFLSLRAANYREIARSCDCATEAEAVALLPFATGEKSRGGQKANNRQQDDYMECAAYAGHPDVGIGGFAGLVKFTHASGEHYFAWYDDDGTVLMRSEGYPTTGARDNGMASVAKNRELEERYSVVKDEDQYFTVLKAGNHQEIARSCGYDNEAAALALFPSARAEAARLKAAALAAAEKNREEDNYLACKEYVNRGEADGDDIVKWQHENGEYYFTWVNNDGSVKMRSEGYPTKAARDNGAASVVKNRDLKERYEVIEKIGKHFVVLKAGNHQEIARSCPKNDLASVWSMFPLLGAGAAIPTVVEATPSVSLADAAPLAAGAAALAGGAAALAADATPKAPPPPVYETPAVAAVTEEAKGGAFPWWWLLAGLLLLGLLWWLVGKGCNASTPAATGTTASTTSSTIVPADTVKNEASTASRPPVTEVAALKDCALNWIFFDFNKADISAFAEKELQNLAKILKENDSYSALLVAHTDAKGSVEYNRRLSMRRADNAKQVLVALGIDAARIKTEAEGKEDPAAVNTDDDNGRHFNRRVELFVKDKAGNNVCKSNPPAIPNTLKTDE